MLKNLYKKCVTLDGNFVEENRQKKIVFSLLAKGVASFSNSKINSRMWNLVYNSSVFFYFHNIFNFTKGFVRNIYTFNTIFNSFEDKGFIFETLYKILTEMQITGNNLIFFSLDMLYLKA